MTKKLTIVHIVTFLLPLAFLSLSYAEASEVTGTLSSGVTASSGPSGTIGGTVTGSTSVTGSTITGTVSSGSTGGSGGGSGGGSSNTSPRCDAFALDDGTLSWETQNGYDLSITRNGVEIFDTTDDDEVDEGTFITASSPKDIFELTVNRGSNEDVCRITLPAGIVLGVSNPGTNVGGSVTQGTPSFPNSGFAPDETNFTMNILGIVAILVSSFLLARAWGRSKVS